MTSGFVPRSSVALLDSDLLAIFVQLGLLVVADGRVVGIDFESFDFESGVIFLELFVLFPLLIFLKNKMKIKY
jgi:hypothetical protein